VVLGTAYASAKWRWDASGRLGLLDTSQAYHDLDAAYDSVDYTVTVENTSHDVRDRVTAVEWTVDDGSTSPTYRFDYAYDPADRVVAVEYPTVGGGREEVTYSYHSRTGRPTDADTDLSGADPVIVDGASWTASGQPDAYVLGSDTGEEVYRSWTYKDGSQRLARIRAGRTRPRLSYQI